MPFVTKAKAFDKSFKGAKCVTKTINSSNINWVIRIIKKKVQNRKKEQTTYKQTKTKSVYKKRLSSNINKVIKAIVVWVNGVVS